MPPPIELLERAARLLSQVHLDLLRAEPLTVQPFGVGSTIRWHASRPSDGAAVQFLLNGSTVPAEGSRVVHPMDTTTYTLSAAAYGLRRALGSVTVVLDAHACRSGSIPEGVVRQALSAALDRVLAGQNQIHSRAPARIEVTNAGIEVNLRFEISVDNFFDPDLNIDFTIALRAVEGRPVAAFTRFNVDVDWPWYVGVITLGISEYVESVLTDKIEGRLKPVILQEAQSTIEDYLRLIPPSYRLFRLRAVTDEIDYTICPALAASLSAVADLRPS